MEQKLKTLIILFKAQETVERSVKKSLECSNLTVNEFAAMEALYTKHCLTTQELIDAVLIPNSSMTYVLDTLKAKGYIQRIRKPEDKRIQSISLTESGNKVFEDVYQHHYEYMKEIFEVLDPEEEVQLQELLKKLGKFAEEKNYDKR